jgi:hypothetical protein
VLVYCLVIIFIGDGLEYEYYYELIISRLNSQKMGPITTAAGRTERKTRNEMRLRCATQQGFTILVLTLGVLIGLKRSDRP